MNRIFNVRFESVIGQQLYLTGSCDDLGKWDKEKAIPLTYTNKNEWSTTIELRNKKFEYQYFLKDERDGSVIEEWSRRTFDKPSVRDRIVIKDVWYYPSLPEFNLNTDFFKVIASDKEATKPRRYKKNTHSFRINFRPLGKYEQLHISGSSPKLGNWDETKSIEMKWLGDGCWRIDLDLTDTVQNIEYKYLVKNYKTNEVEYFETGPNRVASSIKEGEFIVYNDVSFGQPVDKKWRGSGIAVPVFSLRSEESCGVGEFLDLIEFGKWTKDAGFSMIQILPIHDTIAKKDWRDSYPYAAISVYALHPIYIRLSELEYKINASEKVKIKRNSEKYNALDQVDYEGVLNFKFDFLNDYFEIHKTKIYKNSRFQKHIENNQNWLKPYAVFSVLRDKNNTADFTQWDKNGSPNNNILESYFTPNHQSYDKVMFYAFIQWQLHEQLSKAVKSLHKDGITLKGDLPIGIYRHSVDAWWHPELFHMNQQAGAPPDDFAKLGQNWEFPTYNWDKMKEDDLAWWKSRFSFMSRYFDAFRIDHILGFFRIWQIPLTATQGILGRFEPALPVTVGELHSRGIYLDLDRLIEPYITYDLLKCHFRNEVADIIKDYFDIKNDHGGFTFKDEFNTQRKIKNALGENHPHLERLLEITANVLFIKEEDSEDVKLHPRFSMADTYNYSALPVDAQTKLYDLYVDYFFRRQEQFWKKKGEEKLPSLKQATNMLTCGEDLGLVPKVVPELMNDLAILSLQVQRMPAGDEKFSHPSDAPYLSVVSPSSHDTSTLRQWWREDKGNTQYYYNHLMGMWGEAPEELSPNMLENIIDQHLYSPAMLSVIPLQEFLSIDNDLRNKDENIERINVPAVFPHYWRYRMHINISDLIKAKDFTDKLKTKHMHSGRYK